MRHASRVGCVAVLVVLVALAAFVDGCGHRALPQSATVGHWTLPAVAGDGDAFCVPPDVWSPPVERFTRCVTVAEIRRYVRSQRYAE